MKTRKYSRTNRNLVGQKNNLLTAVQKIDRNGRWWWKCSCECGGETTIREDYFVGGKTKSCGCLGSRNSIYKINQKPEGVSALHSYYSSYRRAAHNRGLDFFFTKEEFVKFTKRNCYYCGAAPRELHFNKRANGTTFVNGIDRVNNNIGYNGDNCVSCCKNCNIAKASLSQEEFFVLIKRIYQNRIQENEKK